MSNLTEDVMDNLTAGETPDVATKDIFYSIARDAIVVKEGNEDIILYKYEDQESIDDQVLIFIKTEDEEEEVQVHLVGKQEAVNFEDLDIRLIKHEENEVVLENIVNEPQEEEEGVEYKYVLQESIDDPSNDQLLNYIKTEDEDCQDDFMGEVKVEESNTGLIMYEGDKVPPEYTKDEPKVEHESSAVPQTEDTSGRKDTLDVFLNEFEITSELSTHSTSVKSSGSEETAWAAVDTEDEKEEEALKCSVCGLFCPSYDFLKKHMTSHAADTLERRDRLDTYLNKLEMPLELYSHSTTFKTEGSEKSGDAVFECTDKVQMDSTWRALNTEEEALKCSVNGLVCLGRDFLKRHMTSHASKYPYRCSSCPFSCKKANELIRHVKVMHAVSCEKTHFNVNRSSYQCPFCSYQCTLAHNFQKHMNIHSTCKDQTKQEIFKLESYVSMMPKGHSSSVVKSKENGGTGPNCPDNVNQMKRANPRINSAFKCSVCKLAVTSKNSLTRHTASDKAVYNCSICELPFASERAFNYHVKTDEEYPYMCSECPYVCISGDILKKHKHEKHPEQSKRYYKCPQCSLASEKSEYCNVHRKRFIKIPLHCYFCCYKCESQIDLDKHLEYHAKFKCHMCSRVFRSNLSRSEHMRQSHLNVRRQHCTQCPFTCKLSAELKKHVDKKHTTKKTFKCAMCPYASKYAYALKYHMTTCGSEYEYLPS